MFSGVCKEFSGRFQGVKKSYHARSPENSAWGFYRAVWTFFVNFRSEHLSAQDSGRKFEYCGGFSLCDFCGLRESCCPHTNHYI